MGVLAIMLRMLSFVIALRPVGLQHGPGQNLVRMLSFAIALNAVGPQRSVFCCLAHVYGHWYLLGSSEKPMLCFALCAFRKAGLQHGTSHDVTHLSFVRCS